MAKTLYLLDGMALAYRAHFALIRSPIHTSKGFNTSAIFGFTAAIIDLITNQKPTHLGIVFDTDAPTERHRIHPEYKANRDEMPEDLAAALPHLSRVAEAFDIPVITKDGYEADDIIATLAKRGEIEGFDVFMVTPDKDFGQLVTEKVKIYRPSRKGDQAEILGVDEVKARWGIRRVEQVIDMLGLCGDVSDNIPGIPGIGPKTAEKLLSTYDSIENLIAHSAELKGKQKERVETYADQALLSKKLATIDQAVPIELDWKTLDLNPPEKEKILPILAEFEFRALGKRIFGSDFSLGEALSETQPFQLEGEPSSTRPKGEKGGSPVQGELLPEVKLKTLADIPHQYHRVATPEATREMVNILSDLPGFAFDTETTELNPHRAELVGIAFARLDRREGWFLHLPEPSEAEAREACLEAVRPLFANSAIEKTGHNLKFDLTILKCAGITVAGKLFDTLLAHALTSPEQRHGLDRLAEDLLEYHPIAFQDVFPASGKDGVIDYSKVESEQLKDYAVEDADVSGQLRAILEPRLEANNQKSVFYEIEAPLIEVLADMELTGIRMDPEALSEIGHGLSEKIITLQEKCFALAGRAFNVNSPKQLGEILFDELQIVEKPKKTKTGQYATNEQVLTSLMAVHPIVPTILEHRGLVKLKNTYIDALPGAIEPTTQRVHTHYGQLQTSTGRLSSNNPNLQNIPVRTAEGREVRKAFIPAEGWVLLSADYSQIELRILAALSEDEGLLQAFQKGQDIHTATAARIYRVPAEEVTREMRSKAKMVNFGIPYGISAFGLAQRLGTSRREAQDLIENYFEQFPGVPGYMARMKQRAAEKGYVETVSGRRRALEDINSKNNAIRSGAERNAINMPIQGTAADMIKLAMVHVYRELKRANLKAKLLLQVHDELILEVPPEEVEAVSELVRREMRHALPLKCPIEVEVGTGQTWLEAH